VEREALLVAGADVRQVRMEDPVEAGPAAEAAGRPDQRLDLDVLGLLELRDLHQVGAHGGRADEEHVVFLGGVHVLQVEMRQRPRGERERHRLRRAEIARGARQHADDVLVDLAVQHLDRRTLHDAAAVALAGEDVELGALGLVVPLDQRGGHLRERIDARRDVAVEAARHGGGAAGTGHQEHGRVDFRHPSWYGSPTPEGTNVPKAYSYIRMSTQEQLKGDSMRRQMEATAKYCADHGLELVQDMRDVGFSGFSGANIERGALGKFLKAVEAGKVERGSYLIIESFDRLSRQHVATALELFLGILRNGIVIHTSMDGRTYTFPPEMTELIISIIIMSRAYEESATKSKRVAAAWKGKRLKASETDFLITKIVPGWIRVVGEKLELIPERAAVVEQMFRDTADGGMGADIICRRLNQAGVPTFGKSKAWHVSYIQRLLANQAVMGVFVPKTRPSRNKRVVSDTVIPNYYPRCVSDDLFYRAQTAKEQRRTYASFAGRKGHGLTNLFSGLMFCGTCGQKMRFENKMNARGKRFVCQDAKRGVKGNTCYQGGWNYNHFETSFLAFVREADLASIALNPDSELANLDAQIRATEGRLVEANSQLEKTFALAMDDDKPSKFLAKKISELESAIEGLESELETLKRRHEAIAAQSRTFDESKHALLIAEIQGDSFERRAQLAQHLKGVIDRILVFPGGSNPRVKPEVEEQMLAWYGAKWVEHVAALPEMSPERRFFQVIFKDNTYRLVRPDPKDPARVLEMMATGEEWLKPPLP
jgi:DNA invertase Pin-like site-specific DNA recombinase